MQNGESLKNLWRDQALLWLEAAEQDAKRVLSEFSEVDLPESSPQISQEPWRHHPKEALINFFFEWFIP